jgi:multidrug efflux pump subunit AcrA (membrane-fusion protein)
MRILDTAVTLTSLRDDIKNQRYAVEEARITLDQAKYEPPATIRKAEANLNMQQRALDQRIKRYDLRIVQTNATIRSQQLLLQGQIDLVNNLQNFLSKFTIRAPSAGMIIYKKDRLGNKRKTGSSVNPFDNVIATLPDLTSMISKVYVSEIEVTRVQPGQKATITIDAFPDKSFIGTVLTVANIGETLPNSDAKMFEVQLKVDGSDMNLRPAMTTWNKIIIKTFDDAIYIPLECVQAGADSIPFVYKRNKTKQIVVLGEQNDKFVIVRQGLEPGQDVYTIPPEEPEKFRLTGEDLIAVARENK